MSCMVAYIYTTLTRRLLMYALVRPRLSCHGNAVSLESNNRMLAKVSGARCQSYAKCTTTMWHMPTHPQYASDSPWTPSCPLTGVLLSLPWKKFGQIFLLQKSVLMGLNFIPHKIRVVIGSSCRRFLQPKNARLCHKDLGAKTQKKGTLTTP